MKASLGVIGGLGPQATALFLKQLVFLTDAATDQEHLDVIIFNRPSIPDRTAYLLGKSEDSPLPQMLAVARQLVELQATHLAAPCVTSHAFYAELARSCEVPFINMVEETAQHLADEGVSRAGILATAGSIRTALFQRALEARGIEWVVPDEAGQADVRHLIYENVKAGRPAELGRLSSVSESLRRQGAESLILGCTELSVIMDENEIGPGYLDALQALARACVLACGKPLHARFETLIS